jgi:hypothetical protein
MFGPLPLLHRAVTVTVALASGLLLGAWLAHVTSLAIPFATVLGTALGLGAAYILVHQPEPRPVRVDRRR